MWLQCDVNVKHKKLICFLKDLSQALYLMEERHSGLYRSQQGQDSKKFGGHVVLGGFSNKQKLCCGVL